jgi:hypothetical protein
MKNMIEQYGDIAERLKNAESRQSNQSDVLATLKREILPHELQAV